MRLSRLLPLLLLAGLAAPASAQVLDGTWFKVKVTAKGWAIDTSDGTAHAATHVQTVYVSLLELGIGYSAQFYTQQDGEWVGGPSIELGTTGAGELFVVNQPLTIPGPGGSSLDLSATLRLIFKFNGNGELTKATIKTLAGELKGSSTLNGEDLFIGSVKLTGKLVQPQSLPF
jgi:hypothetical protein